ncbi:MAG: hypothetical protein AAF648_01345 [Pseudomonadota bacterium]
MFHYRSATLVHVAGLVSLGAIAFPAPTLAEFTLGPKAGTLGFGLEGSYAFNDRFGIRAGLNTFDYSWDDDLDGVSYDGDLELQSTALLLDYRPAANGFRISAGILLNGTEINGVADPAATYDIGENTYTFEESGDLSATAEFDRISPYVGIGYDFRRESAIRISFDLGVAFQGDPDVSIRTVGGTLSDDSTLRADLDAEEASFQSDLEGLDIYPVLSIGISYAFE